MRVLRCVIAGLVFGGAPLVAQVTDSLGVGADTTEVRPRFRLPEIRATARAEPRLYRTRVLDLSGGRGGGSALSQWLNLLPGLQTRGAGPGGRETVSIRGSRPEGVRVTLDGLPLNDPLTGVADLSLLSGSSVERADLTFGAGAAPGWGGTAGAVSLESVSPDPGVRLRAVMGSYGRRSTEVDAGWESSAGRLGLFARSGGAENDYTFRNRILPGEPLERRVNADAASWQVIARADLDQAPLSFLGRIDDIDRGAPGRMGNHVWDESRWREQRTSFAVRWRPEAGGPRATLGWARTAQTYADARVGREESLAARQLVSTGSIRLPLRLEATWNASWADIDGDRIARRARWIGGASLARTDRVGNVSLHSALTLDAADEGLAVSPALGVALDLTPTWRLSARAAQARRLPSFADLFLRPGLGALPNRDLRPERVTLDGEVSLEWGTRRFSASAGLFRRHTTDPILWLPSVISVWTPSNLGRLRATGLELDASASLSEAWRVDVAGTWQTSHVGFEDGVSTAVPYEPGLAGSATVRHVSPVRTLLATLAIVGRRKTNLFSAHELPTYALLNIRARQTFHIMGLEGEIDVGVLNALDSTYERVELFPEPGRRYEIGLSIAMGRRVRLPGPTSEQSFPRAAEQERETQSESERTRRVSSRSGHR